MSHDVYYQFIQPLGQARRAGARGGKATARNGRERQDGAAAAIPEPQASEAEPPPIETTAAAIALLDAQYPWLRGAEKAFSNPFASGRLAKDPTSPPAPWISSVSPSRASCAAPRLIGGQTGQWKTSQG